MVKMKTKIVTALALAFALAGQASAAGSQTVAPASQAPAVAVPSGALIPELMGRWDLSFRSPQANLDTVWVVEPSAHGATSLGAVGNNPVGLSVNDARLSNGVVSLAGTTSMGALTITARFENDRMVGTFTAGSMRGDFSALRRGDVRVTPLVQIFDNAVGTFEQSLFTPAPFDPAWQARRNDMRAQLTRPGATERDMARAVRTLVSAARMSHNNFYIPATSEAEAEIARTSPAVTWRRLDGGLGYIRIDSFVENPVERDRIDAAFAELSDTRGLVIDLRGNGGGNLGLAMRLGDHLFPANTPAGLFATRKGLNAAGVASMDSLPAAFYRTFDGYSFDQFQDVLADAGAVTLLTGGRAPPYAAPVALLIDANSASTSEAMAAVMKETRRARLFGATTAGAMLSSRTFPVEDGYVLRVAFADFRTPGGAVAEKIGVAPDQTVRGGPEAVLAAATRWLQSSRSTRR